MFSNIPRLVSATRLTEHEARIGDLKCYSLPYGAIGFSLHIITIYIILMLCNQRSPWSFHKLVHKGFDITLSAMCLWSTFVAGIMNMSRCHFHNSFTAIAFNELLLSACFSCLCWAAATWIGWEKETRDIESAPATTPESTSEQRTASADIDSKEGTTFQNVSNDHASEITAVEDVSPQTNTAETNSTYKKSPSDSFFWLTPYFIGATVTLAALLRIVYYEIHDNRKMERISLVFVTAATITIVLLVIASFCGVMAEKSSALGRFGFFIFVLVGVTMMGIGIFGPLYTDWVLASMQGNWAGIQSSTGGNALIYWAYFTARLLPFFCF